MPAAHSVFGMIPRILTFFHATFGWHLTRAPARGPLISYQRSALRFTLACYIQPSIASSLGFQLVAQLYYWRGPPQNASREQSIVN
jgi:hypothetical protein